MRVFLFIFLMSGMWCTAGWQGPSEPWEEWHRCYHFFVGEISRMQRIVDDLASLQKGRRPVGDVEKVDTGSIEGAELQFDADQERQRILDECPRHLEHIASLLNTWSHYSSAFQWMKHYGYPMEPHDVDTFLPKLVLCEKEMRIALGLDPCLVRYPNGNAIDDHYAVLGEVGMLDSDEESHESAYSADTVPMVNAYSRPDSPADVDIGIDIPPPSPTRVYTDERVPWDTIPNIHEVD